MNIHRFALLLLFTHSIYSFSQAKEDVYFILNDSDKEYRFYGNLDLERDYITLYNRKEYEYHQKEVEEAKNKGTYYYDPESSRDNLGINVSKLTFEVLSSKRLILSESDIKKLNIVDYKWILGNSWKKIAKQPYDFKDIYFLYSIEGNQYIQYKVGVTIVSH